MDGWMEGWMDGWMDGRDLIQHSRIVYSNKKNSTRSDI